MRIYTTAIEMVKEVERDLYEMGTRYQSATCQDQDVKNDPGYQTIELCGYAYALTQFNEKDLLFMLNYTEANIPWVFAETDERLDHTSPFPLNPGKAWEKNSEFWEKFLRDGYFSYSYPERWQEQIHYIINELTLRPNSRQAVMTMYDRHQDMMNWGGRDRVPCSLTYQFMLREDRLVLIYNQRSCDFRRFFTSDVYITVQLLLFVAEAIKKDPGQFIHFLGSLHAFAKDLEGRNIF